MRAIRNRRLRAAASLGVLFLFLVSSCGAVIPSDGPPPATPVKKANLVAGVVPDETNAALFLAQERGIFAAHGLHLTIRTIVSTQFAVPQLLDGSLDIAAGQLPTWLAAQAKGLGPFRVLHPGVELGPNVDEIVALDTSQISNAGQLRGRVIGVNAAAGNLGAVRQTFQASLGVSHQVATVMSTGIFPPTMVPNQILQIATLMGQFGELGPNTNLSSLATALTTGK